jgi:hypothetical protein
MKWYTVRCSDESAKWVKEQNPAWWKELYPDSKFMIMKNKIEIYEPLYIMMKLKFDEKSRIMATS